MLIKLQQKIIKKILQFTTANSQQSTITFNSTSHIITNVHIEIIIFDKNEKSTLRKRERSSKKHSIVFFSQNQQCYIKKI